jgi:hypothetical protein
LKSRRKLDSTSERERKMSEEIKKEELDEIPKLRAPVETYVWAVAGILGIFAFAVAMLYTWFQILS